VKASDKELKSTVTERQKEMKALAAALQAQAAQIQKVTRLRRLRRTEPRQKWWPTISKTDQSNNQPRRSSGPFVWLRNALFGVGRIFLTWPAKKERNRHVA
jgi:type II secretory pathway pseudopilin PulG